jgi:predicted protein tyrosine phosphatase
MALKILFVCTQGRHRSRTAAEHIRACLPGVETRYAGVSADADVPVSVEDVTWADTIICMEQAHRSRLRQRWSGLSRKIRVWGIPDEYQRGEPALVSLIESCFGMAPKAVEPFVSVEVDEDTPELIDTGFVSAF